MENQPNQPDPGQRQSQQQPDQRGQNRPQQDPERQYQTDYGDGQKSKMPHGDEVEVNESDTKRDQ